MRRLTHRPAFHGRSRPLGSSNDSRDAYRPCGLAGGGFFVPAAKARSRP